jgi:recombination protein RecT
MNTENKNLPTVKEKNIIDDVLSKVVQFRESGELVLPKDYSAENALKSAYLILSEAVDKQKNPVLTVCTKASIANSLLDMVVQGLSPMKNQCYFIPYGDKLQLSRSYLGSIAVARRVGLKSIVANVVFQDDIFSYQIDSKTGLYSIIDHTQELQNIDISKIRGA